jgi:BlaI family transcriptional regulator, penicillinase repressor
VMVALLGSKSPTPEELDRLRAMIDEAQRQSFLKPISDDEGALEET